LLEANRVAEALIVTNGPRIAVDLVHVGRGDARDLTLLDDLGILSHDGLDLVELLGGDLAMLDKAVEERDSTYNRLKTIQLLPLGHLLDLEVNKTIIDLAVRKDDDNISNSSRTVAVGRMLEPSKHLSLARLVQRDDVEVAWSGMVLLDNVDGSRDLIGRERIERVREYHGCCCCLSCDDVSGQDQQRSRHMAP
jgi:hypothetical protein